MSSTHAIMPSEEIVLDGRKFNLIFDFNAQCAFEEVSGTTVLELIDKRGRPKISSRYTRALLWSQLLHDDEQVRFDEYGRIVEPPEFSMQKVGNFITRDTLNEISTKTRKAFVQFFRAPNPAGEAEDSKNPPNR
jgi:hypothetical protein